MKTRMVVFPILCSLLLSTGVTYAFSVKKFVSSAGSTLSEHKDAVSLGGAGLTVVVGKLYGV